MIDALAEYMPQGNWIHLDVKLIVKETDRAFLLRLDDDTEHWIPKNQISDPDDYEEGDKDCSVSITEWIAEQKGIA